MTSHPTIPASSSLPFFVFDVESVGLHGEAFAVAGGTAIALLILAVLCLVAVVLGK